MTPDPPAPTPRRATRWRRILGLAAALVVMALGGTYWYLTRPAQIRAYATRWLSEFTGGHVDIERASFDPFGGLTLVGVTLALPENSGFEPGNDSLEARTVFTSSSVALRLDVRQLLHRQVRVREVVAVDPELIFVQRSSDGVDNWQWMLEHRPLQSDDALSRPKTLPVIRLRNARLQEYRIGERGRTSASVQTVWADAAPLPAHPRTYDVRLTKIVKDEKTRELVSDPGRLQIDMDTLAVSGHLPAMNLDELLFASTPAMLQWMDLLAMTGTIRPEQLELSPDRRRVTLALSDASLAVPIDEREHDTPPAERYLRFEQIAGRVRFEGDSASVELAGRFHGAPIRLQGTTRIDPSGTLSGLDALGLDLTLQGTEVLLPRNEPERHASEARFVTRWPQLANFVRDFDGVGRADVSVHLHKPAQRGAGIDLLDGRLEPKNVSARYIGFPYRVTHMSGVVQFRPDGTETIELKGMHNNAVLTFSGWEGGFKTQAGDLVIRGVDVPLDDDLRTCLSEEDRRLCERFGLQARMDLDIHMTRADAPPGTPDNPWKSVIDVTLRDGALQFDRFPYPLDTLRGQIRIAGGTLDIRELTARRQGASVRVTGTANWSDPARPDVNLLLDAKGVPLDSVLGAALPDEVRDRYRKIAPVGVISVAGAIQSTAASEHVDYDLVLGIVNTSANLPSGSRLTDIAGRVQLRRTGVTVESLEARLGESALQAEGTLPAELRGAAFDLHVMSPRLALSDTTRGALPQSLREIWDDFAPAGEARVDVHIRRKDSSTRPASTQADDDAYDYQAVIEPLGASATYAAFPLPLEDVRGSISLSSDRVEIRSMRMRTGDASISLFGTVEPEGEHNHVRLAVQARRLKLDAKLRQAMHWRIRRQWDVLKPTGELDVDFSRLEFTTGQEMPTWSFDGKAIFRDFALQIGSEIGAVNGSIEGTGRVGDAIEMDSALRLQSIAIDGRLLRDVFARLKREPGSSIVQISELKADLYGGAVVGHAELDYEPSPATFDVWIQASGVSLEQFLNAKRKAGEERLQARGLIDGQLTLSGRFDQPASRRGSGEVSIREAQVFKIPLMFSLLQVVNLTLDNNAFHDALLHFYVQGRELVLDAIDLRGKALSMVGTGRVDTEADTLNLTFLMGGPLRLPRLPVLTDIVEDVARELMEVRVEGTIDKPKYRAEVVRGLRKPLDELLKLQRRGFVRP